MSDQTFGEDEDDDAPHGEVVDEDQEHLGLCGPVQTHSEVVHVSLDVPLQGQTGAGGGGRSRGQCQQDGVM